MESADFIAQELALKRCRDLRQDIINLTAELKQEVVNAEAIACKPKEIQKASGFSRGTYYDILADARRERWIKLNQEFPSIGPPIEETAAERYKRLVAEELLYNKSPNKEQETRDEDIEH